jgi:hypothetical protein
MLEIPEPVKPNDQWIAARSLLDHYQTVLNQRFTWVTALEGFVFTAFALTVNSATNAKTEFMANLLWLGVIAISIVGGILPWLFVPAIQRYGERLQGIRDYWEKLGHEGFPPLRREPTAKGWARLETLPILMSAAWLVAILFGVIALFSQTVPPSTPTP